jgi:hypothetical protein
MVLSQVEIHYHPNADAAEAVVVWLLSKIAFVPNTDSLDTS